MLVPMLPAAPKKKKKKPLDILHPYCRRNAQISAPKISFVCLANFKHSILKFEGIPQDRKRACKGSEKPPKKNKKWKVMDAGNLRDCKIN